MFKILYLFRYNNFFYIIIYQMYGAEHILIINY